MEEHSKIHTSSALTHPGLVRSSNQDSYLLASDIGLFAVADGMGGHAGGEIASAACIEAFADFVKSNNANLDRQQTLKDAALFANTRIFDLSLEDPTYRGMGTTLCASWIVEGVAYIAHVGDSRFYLIRCGLIYQITKDHSLISQQLAAGILTPNEAKKHHLKNVITRSIGYKSSEHIDIIRLPLRSEDILVLCSDGLHGKLEDWEMARIVTSSNPDEAVHELVALANKRGGEDNISVVVVLIKPD